MKETRVLNLGGGVQSTTIALMAQYNLEAVREGRLKPYSAVDLVDYAIFADTGDEPWKVYLHLCWLRERCSFPILVRSIHAKRNRILTRLFPIAPVFNGDRARRYLARLRRIEVGTLRGSLRLGINSTGQRFASIPAFTWDGQTLRMTRAGHVPNEGRTRRQCTAEWKIDCVERTIRRELVGLSPGERMPTGEHFVQIFGLSYEEPSRILRARRNFQTISWATPRFPLFEMEQTRGGCIGWLRKHGPPYVVARSACTHCPLHGNEEWRAMRDTDPDSWMEAIGVDESLRTTGAVANRDMNQTMYLHRSCKPLAEAPIDEPETKKLQEVFGFAQECEGMCGL